MACAILIAVLPDFELAKGGVVGIDEVVLIEIELAQGLEAVSGKQGDLGVWTCPVCTDS